MGYRNLRELIGKVKCCLIKVSAWIWVGYKSTQCLFIFHFRWDFFSLKEKWISHGAKYFSILNLTSFYKRDSIQKKNYITIHFLCECKVGYFCRGPGKVRERKKKCYYSKEKRYKKFLNEALVNITNTKVSKQNKLLINHQTRLFESNEEPIKYKILKTKNVFSTFKNHIGIQQKMFLQVNLCQKHSFLNQLTHNMTTDCSLIYNFSARKIQVKNMFYAKVVCCFCFGLQNNICTQHVLNLYFSNIELVIQWTICCHIVD